MKIHFSQYFTLLGFVNPFLISLIAVTGEECNGRIEAIVVQAQLTMSYFSFHCTELH